MNGFTGYYVYMYIGQDNCPFYVGKGKDQKSGAKRWRPQNHTYAQTHTARKIRKISVKNVKVYFLYKNLTEKEAFKYERYYISVFGRLDNGTGILTNHTDGGEGVSGIMEKVSWNKGISLSEETKRKIRVSRTGQKLSEEHKRKISKSMEGKPGPMLGKCHTDETKQKMKEARSVYLTKRKPNNKRVDNVST